MGLLTDFLGGFIDANLKQGKKINSNDLLKLRRKSGFDINQRGKKMTDRGAKRMNSMDLKSYKK